MGHQSAEVNPYKKICVAVTGQKEGGTHTVNEIPDINVSSYFHLYGLSTIGPGRHIRQRFSRLDTDHLVPEISRMPIAGTS